MILQLLSDLHLETEDYQPAPAAGAHLLVLAGDIDARWDGLARFAGWPVPVLFVAGNHEFDGRELNEAWPALRAHCAALGLRLLERESIELPDPRDGRRIRFLGTVRWCDFDLFGAAGRAKAERAGGYFQRVMQARLNGESFDAAAVRQEALACREWLAQELHRPSEADATVVITHFAPSLRSADPRYGAVPATASFCNADDDLLPLADLWLHGHLHCRQDYRVLTDTGPGTRVVSQARGHSSRGEPEGFDGSLLFHV